MQHCKQLCKILNPKNFLLGKKYFIPDNGCCVAPHNMGVVEEHSSTREDKWSRVEGGGRLWLSWWLVIKNHTFFFLSDEFIVPCVWPSFLCHCWQVSSLCPSVCGCFVSDIGHNILLGDTYSLSIQRLAFYSNVKMCYILPKLQYYTIDYILWLKTDIHQQMYMLHFL